MKLGINDIKASYVSNELVKEENKMIWIRVMLFTALSFVPALLIAV